jgi:hypothetical protein
VYSFTTGDKNGIFRDKGVDSNWCNVTLVLHVSENGSSYPSTIGAGLTPQQKTQLLLYLVSLTQQSALTQLLLCPLVAGVQFMGVMMQVVGVMMQVTE